MELADILKRIPEARLRAFELARQITNEGGDLDWERAASLAQEIEAAVQEARNYAEGVRRLASALREQVERAP